MIDMLANADMKLVVVLVGAAVLPFLLRWPPALGRWLSANELAAPWWVTLFFLGGAALSGTIVAFHIRKLLEVTTQEAPAEPTVGAFLGWLLGFVSEGVSGPLLTRAHAQAALVWLILLALCTVLVYRQRYSIFAMDIVARRGEEAVPRRIVVMGLSLDPRLEKDRKAAEQEIAAFSAAASALDLKAASAPLPELRFPWQQNLRVLGHHLLPDLPAAGWVKRAWRRVARRPPEEPCRVAVVVPSRESAPHAEAFVAVAKACAANSGRPDVQFKIWPRAVDYNDLAALRSELLAVVRMLQESKAIAARLDEISIDTTPGMKLVSIAGAAVTFASPLEFTYVETAAPNRVVAFDVRAAFRVPFER